MSEREPNPQVAAFFERLQRLDPGERARLKRAAGQTLAESRDALGLFYSLLPFGMPPAKEEIYFFVATLYPMAEGGNSGDLGAALRRARQDKNAKGLDRRVEILLDADATQLPFRLRQAIRFLQSNRVRVDWPYLLQDLLYWTHPDRFVQRQWARSYFSISKGG
jgi:CRISPR system Cascade subunit CasB